MKAIKIKSGAVKFPGRAKPAPIRQVLGQNMSSPVKPRNLSGLKKSKSNQPRLMQIPLDRSGKPGQTRLFKLLGQPNLARNQIGPNFIELNPAKKTDPPMGQGWARPILTAEAIEFEGK